MTAALSVRGLVAGYDGVPVVRDIDLDIGPGTFLAMVGANGAGKTTTLRAIMGLCDVFAGTVELGDRSLAGSRTSARVLAGLALCPGWPSDAARRRARCRAGSSNSSRWGARS